MKNLDILKNLLLNPQKAWLAIEQEPSSLQKILKYQLLVFALFPVVGTFLVDVVIGVEMFESVYRKPILTALVNSILYYLAIIIFVFLLSYGLKIMASFFDTKVLFISAFKLINYSVYPVFIFTLFLLIPGASFLAYAVAFYAVYIFHKGLPILIKNHYEKSLILTTLMMVLLIIVMSILVVLMELFSNTLI